MTKYLIIFLILVISGLAIFLIFFNRPKPAPDQIVIPNLTVSSVTPPEGGTEIGIYSPIKADFSRSISGGEQTAIRFSSSPQINGNYSWSADSRSLTLTPTIPLLSNQRYEITAIFGANNFKWAFNTVSLDNVSNEDRIKAQNQADLNYAQKTDDVYKLYPWLDDVDIRTDNYFVYFNVDEKQFVAKLYPNSKSSTSTDQQVEEMKAEITEKLKTIVPDFTKYNIRWDIKIE